MSDLIAVYTDDRNEGGGTADSVDVYAAGFAAPVSGLLFSDGFESGDVSAWSLSVP